ncbi:acetyl-CoA synthetase [Phakopsora pachyrhizi]|uniref:Acetyl-coenzyme A synthetase n=1 Tax=Phakopsora pachyrhizi TaxID=170000 RepID=A0AAV0BK28_PHAPC|nr:acetyl-CoA synthetase [Phakopsora pachyrhizi]CAH7687682.1 acetyl-CoA synthetase [Phakopsora pachyrhizi]
MVRVSKLPIAHRTDPVQTNGDVRLPRPHLDESEFLENYRLSLERSDEFWDKRARETIDWIRPYNQISSGTFDDLDRDGKPIGNFTWFTNGGLNACYNCLDRWVAKYPDRTAIIWIADEDDDSFELSFREVLDEVCRLANVLKSYGVKKGDTVAIYLPMVPAAIVAFLACARIGAIHSVVFAGFSSDSLRDRIQDARSKVVITSDEARRGGKTIPTKKIVDDAIQSIPSEIHQVHKVIVFHRIGSKPVNMLEPRDVWWDRVCKLERPFCPLEVMDSEDPLFILYTSGSTGRPKGLVHTTAGYLLGAAMTVKYVFDVHEGDRFACMADVGWITGHTYIVYGPLMNGVSTTVFESTPIYPDPSRYWQSVEKYKLTQFYTAPTAIRLLKKLGDSYVENFDLSSLRTIGSVGEPINPQAWEWYNDMIGKKQCAVVDTYWQTETGSHIITPIPGAIQTKPGSATLPFFGIEPVILEPTTGERVDQRPGEGVLVIKRPFPSMARTIYGDHSRFVDTYLNVYPGYYFTGDGAEIDEDGYFWIKGRVDDVLNVSGHRLSTAEIESALVHHPAVAEAAVVGAPDETTGQSIQQFKESLKAREGKDVDEEALSKEMVNQVRKIIGPFASPKKIYLVDDLPKTRSGKIMRRILRKIVSDEIESLGDLSTLSDPKVVERIIQKVSKN